jgi:hypothetical protein
MTQNEMQKKNSSYLKYGYEYFDRIKGKKIRRPLFSKKITKIIY